MKPTIPYSIVFLLLFYAQQSLSMENPTAPDAGKGEETYSQPPNLPSEELVEPPVKFYPPKLPPESNAPLPDPNADANQPQPPPVLPNQPIPPVPPVPPVPESFYTRIHGSVNKWTGFVDSIVTTPIAGLPGMNTLYTKFPVTTKLMVLGFAVFVFSHTPLYRKGVDAIQEMINKLVGNSDIDIDDDEDEEDDDEVNRPVYNNKLLQKL